ncbi:MAG: hypothetical protein JEY97_06755 [Bacteroidales bacterium]|nr:hypothetical protein [Bacteroidales bacterium]
MRKLLFFCLLFLLACQVGFRDDSEEILARVGDEYLYASELDRIIIPGVSAKDSLILSQNFINNWIRQKLLLKHAEKNLTYDQKDFSTELDDYRNSLIIYKYETLLIEQRLDTIITEEEIEDYYNKNNKNFELKDNIVKVSYVKIHVDSPGIDKIRYFINSDSLQFRDSLEKYCSQYAIKYFLDNESWILFDELIKEIPISTYNYEVFLKNNRYVEIRDNPYYYIAYFDDFEIKDGISPLSFERENIINYIINQRKVKLVNDLKEKTFREAIENNEFEIY